MGGASSARSGSARWVTRWRWRLSAVRVVAGLMLAAPGVAMYVYFTEQSEARVTSGIAVKAAVLDRSAGRGPNSVTVRYQWSGTSYDTRLWSVLGDAGGYERGAGTMVYLDSADPRRAALQGGFTSDAAWWTAWPTIPLIVFGATVVVLATVKQFRHRIPLSTDFEQFERLRGEVPALTLGIEVGDEDAAKWRPAYRRLRSVLPANPSGGVRVRVEFLIARQGMNVLDPDFRGVRVGPYSQRRRILKIAVTVPADTDRPPDAALREALNDAIVAGGEFADRKGIRDQLADARRAASNLPQANAMPDIDESDVLSDGPPTFTVALRGYDIRQVDAVVERVYGDLAGRSPVAREDALSAVRARRFQSRLRGYDRYQVDSFLNWLERELQ